jgi:hypothetical protein
LRGLRELATCNGEHFVTEPRGAEGQGRASIPDLAAELVRLQVDVIVAVAAALPALKRPPGPIPSSWPATRTRSGAGFVQSLGRPGGNITGLSLTVGGADRQACRAPQGAGAERGPDRRPLGSANAVGVGRGRHRRPARADGSCSRSRSPMPPRSKPPSGRRPARGPAACSRRRAGSSSHSSDRVAELAARHRLPVMLRVRLLRRGRWADCPTEQTWWTSGGARDVRRQDPEGAQDGRAAGRAAVEVRARHQSGRGERAGPGDPELAAAARRIGCSSRRGGAYGVPQPDARGPRSRVACWGRCWGP